MILTGSEIQKNVENGKIIIDPFETAGTLMITKNENNGTLKS